MTEAIAASIRNFIPLTPKKIIVCGGGAKNPTILRFLRQRIKEAPVCTAEECGFNSMGIEAQAFAYLAVRRLQQMPTSYPFTTGAVQEVIGGEVFEPRPRG